MSMIVKNNMEALRTLNVLNQNTSALQKTLEQVSSGQKIVGAKDDASGYGISEKMREQIRTLTQDNQNIQNGSFLFKVAEGGISNIVEELRNLKELAINAANDTNTDGDRATIQKEFSQKMANINDIATTTNYNGKILLDGSYSQKFNVSTLSANDSSSSEPVNFNAVEPTGNSTVVNSGNFTISTDGVYELAAGYSGTITIKAQNVKITQSNPSVALNNVYMVGSSGGNTNLWIENLNVQNTQDKSFIKFQNANNILSFKGTNNVTVSNSTSRAHSSAVINVGKGLTLKGGTDGSGVFNLNVGTHIHGAIIGSDAYINQNDSTVTVLDGTFNISNAGAGAAVGAGVAGTFANILINGGTFNDSSTNYAALIGSGTNGGTVGDIYINNATINSSGYKTYSPTIGSGTGTVGNISIKNSAITHSGQYGAGIGSGGGVGAPVYAGNIVIENSTLNIQTDSGAGIGSGEGSSVGNITIKDTDLSNVKSTQADDVGKGVNGNCGTINAESSSAPSNSILDTALKIQHGAKANQVTNFYINDMHTKSLGTGNLIKADGTFAKDSDKEMYKALALDSESPYQTDKQAEYLATVTAAQNKTLDDIDVKTKYNANIAIRVLDGAIDYALDQATRIGAYLQRLDYTNSNVTTMGENVQSAESTIRDADLAKEMTAYTKNNVMTQAAQSMLAQANQNSSSVLSLLQ